MLCSRMKENVIDYFSEFVIWNKREKCDFSNTDNQNVVLIQQVSFYYVKKVNVEHSVNDT